MVIIPPATIGMSIEDVETPCLMVDLDAFERNVALLAAYVKERGVRHRAHAKTHKSADIALYQIEKGGACGVCCQKVSEAEALVNGGVRVFLSRTRLFRLKRSIGWRPLQRGRASSFAWTTRKISPTLRQRRKGTA